MVVSGAVLQLSSIGPQNAYINNAEFTLFKTVVRKYSNFAAGQILVQPYGGGAGWYGSELVFRMPRAGDLLHKLYFTCTVDSLNLNPQDPNYVLDSNVRWTDAAARALVEYVQIDIGSTKFDRILSEQLDIWSELSQPAGKEDWNQTLTAGLGGALDLQDFSALRRRIFLGLPFWFCRFVEQVLPMIALMFHDVDIRVKLRNQQDVITLTANNVNGALTVWTPVGAPFNTPVPPTHPQFQSSANGPTTVINYNAAANVSGPSAIRGGAINNPQILATYIYLDQLERKLFAGSAHEYVMIQHQYLGPESVGANATNFSRLINFSHPCIEFNVIVRRNQLTQTDYFKDWFDYTGQPLTTGWWDPTYLLGATSTTGLTPVPAFPSPAVGTSFGLGRRGNPFQTFQITLNGHARLPEQTDFGVDYYLYTTNMETHSKIPTGKRRIFTYPFSFRPEIMFANGTLNCSRVDNINFQMTFPANKVDSTAFVYARNFNVIKIASGLAGMRFSS